MTDKPYNISQLAREFDITTRTIRFYEEKGLLQPAREGQKRLYSNADRVRLSLILRGKRIGLSLEESRDIIEMYTPGADNDEQLRLLIDKISQRRRLLTQQMADIQHVLQELDEVEARCLRALNTNH